MVLWLQDPSVDHIWENFLWSVQTGRPAVEKTHGMEAFRWLSTDAEVAAVFNDAMSSNAAVRYAAVLDAYDFSGIQRLVDVGGGHGALMERVLRKVPSVTGVVFDLPAVVAGTSRRLREAGLADRCETMSGDIFSDVPHADAHMMSSVLHDWDDERCVTIVRNCHRASVPGGKLIVLEMVVGGANEPSFAKMLDMQMLALTGGRERTADEFAVIFREGGYRLARVVRTAGPVSVIEGIRE
jgi:SAM-dependent methyltransferase